MLNNLGLLPSIWILFKRPKLLFLYCLIPVLSIYMASKSNSGAVLIFYWVFSTFVFLDLCFYLVFFSGNEPIMLAGVNLRKTKGFFLASLVIQVLSLILGTALILFGDKFPDSGLFVMGIPILLSQNLFKYLAFAKFSFDFAIAYPEDKKMTTKRFSQDISKIMTKKL